MYARRIMIYVQVIACLLAASSFKATASGKSLKRVDDPVVIECGRFAVLNKTPLDRLALMVRSGEAWRPVPFQVDEKKPSGDYAFTRGKRASSDPVAGMDSNDELVFMAADSGDRAMHPPLPERARAAEEIELRDPKTGEKAWVYLVEFEGKAPRSKADYVDFSLDPGRDRWRLVTTEYIMEGNDTFPFPDVIAKNLSSRIDSAEAGPDLIDRLKTRGKLYGPFNVSVDLMLDTIWKAETKAWIDGPVRVLQSSQGYFGFPVFKLEMGGDTTINYYRNHVVWPMHVAVPVDLGFALKKVDLKAYMDFSAGAYGNHCFSDVNEYDEDVVLDGKMSEAEKALNTESPTEWIAGSGPSGGMLCRVEFPPEWDAVEILPYYLDDKSIEDRPEDVPGVSAAGFDLVGFEKLGPFQGTYYQYFYFKRELSVDDAGTLLDILDNPLELKVNAYEERN